MTLSSLNALHIACAMGHKDLLNYLLDKLPKDVIARLLLQQTYESGNTVRDTTSFFVCTLIDVKAAYDCDQAFSIGSGQSDLTYL